MGDEVVVTWKMNSDFDASLCLDFFIAFQGRLKARNEYFLHHYRVCPEFKAGVHCGLVTVAEVGEVKTEIAYHGDVLNTASRIQSLCNTFEKSFLISESIFVRLHEKDRERATFVAEVELRGKEATTKIYTVRDVKHAAATK